MTFDPKPGFRIPLNGTHIEFTSLDESEFIYAEDGKEATVYRVNKDGQPYAFKVFYPSYQDERLIGNSFQLSLFKSLEGLRVAERTVITKQSFPNLVKMYPDLEFAVLMPWIQGNIWGNLFADDRILSGEKYYSIARSFINVVSNLEAKGLAHCDLSNNNFIIGPNMSNVELIDIESMYAPNMPRPVPDISYGTEGYRTPWIAENGLWGPEADRFACAILCSEILTWHNIEIREAKFGDSSYFDEEEIGEKCERYYLMMKHLNNINPEIGLLFDKAWLSENLINCPEISKWKVAIAETTALGVTKTPEPQKKNDVILTEESAKISEHVERQDEQEILRGIPARMIINITSLQFGIIDRPNLSKKFTISNPGGSLLVGDIYPDPWLLVHPTHFSIMPGKQCEVIISIKDKLPNPQGKYEYRSPCGLMIESNVGTEVIGATFSLPKKSFWG